MNGYDETEAFGYGYPEDEEDENERDDRLTRGGVFMNMLPRRHSVSLCLKMHAIWRTWIRTAFRRKRSKS
mgnify:CR=1 FL=1